MAIKPAVERTSRMIDVQEEGSTATVESPSGLRVTILDIGATLRSLEVPTSDGHTDVILSYDKTGDYLDDPFYMGTTAGPFANRIRDARFDLDGERFDLDANERATGHCLHGGRDGLNRQVFELRADPAGPNVECRCELADGLNGFPGNRAVKVVYRLLDEFSLAIDFQVTSDRDTVISLANHAYFNLGGTIDDHLLSIRATEYTPFDKTACPTGEIRSVADTAVDFRELRPVGPGQFDNNLVLSNERGELRHAATLRSPTSGLQLEVLTTQPGLQLYTGDYLDEPFAPRQGICLEAQRFPDTPNHASFPSARLSAGATYQQRTIYRFSSVSP